MSVYIVTTQVRLTGTFRDLAGVLANPTAVVCTVEAPDGTTSTPSVTNSGTGIYYADVTLSQAGTWKVEWQGTGALIVAGDEVVEARASYVDG